MKEDLGEFIKTYRADYESGRLKAGYEAALFCLANGQAIPSWLTPMVEDAVRRHFLTSEGRGRGKSTAQTTSRKAALRGFIKAEVNRLYPHIPKVHAFEVVALDLSGHDAKLWTADMVKAEYYRAQ